MIRERLYMLPERAATLLRASASVRACAWLGVLLALVPAVRAQSDGSSPLPDVPTLIAQCREHQRQIDSVRENYTFHEVDIIHELNKDGSVKKTRAEEYEVFFVNTHEVRRLTKKDGKPLSADDDNKETGRVMKAVQKAQKTPPGVVPEGNVVVSISRILAMAKVSDPRRQTIDGRSNIAFDFAGDPKAKAHGIAEEAAKRMSGTVWIDEKDRAVRRMSARLDENLRVGFGFFSIGKGSNLIFDQKLVNNELWLPTGASINAVGHAVGIFGFRANVEISDNDYKRFHAEATEQTGKLAGTGSIHEN